MLQVSKIKIPRIADSASRESPPFTMADQGRVYGKWPTNSLPMATHHV